MIWAGCSRSRMRTNMDFIVACSGNRMRLNMDSILVWELCHADKKPRKRCLFWLCPPCQGSQCAGCSCTPHKQPRSQNLVRAASRVDARSLRKRPKTTRATKPAKSAVIELLGDSKCLKTPTFYTTFCLFLPLAKVVKMRVYSWMGGRTSKFTWDCHA